MRFRDLEVHRYRNLEDREISWSPGINVLLGPNGAGKTNLLEAMDLLAGWGPFGDRPASVVPWEGSGDTWVRGRLEGEETAVASVQVRGRTLLRWGGSPVRATQMRTSLPVLAFLPDSLSVVEGSASQRRRLLDQVGALVYPPYALRLHDYRRALRQRTACLRRGERDDLVLRVLAPLGVWLWRAREDVVRRLASRLEGVGPLLSAPLELRYHRGGGGWEEDSKEDFRRGLLRHRDRERLSRTPLVGPQRDDLAFLSGKIPAAERFSRGHRRRAAVALMLASAGVVRDALRRDPVLLLDEVTAELDGEGKGILFSSLEATGWQVFAATADADAPLPGAVYRIEGGKVFPPREG